MYIINSRCPRNDPVSHSLSTIFFHSVHKKWRSPYNILPFQATVTLSVLSLSKILKFH